MLELTESQLLLQRTVRDFATKEIAPAAQELDAHEDFPAELVEGLRGLGLMGVGIEPEYGGAGGGSIESTLVMEEICKAYAGLGTIWAVQTGLYGQVVQRFGTEEQKRELLPGLTEGRDIGAYALTEPNAGTDAAALETTAARDGDFYRINGAKTFISCADVATHFALFATVDRSARANGITCFIMPRGLDGISTKKQTGKMGISASTTAEIFFDDVKLPITYRIGDEGYGFKAAMQILDVSRLAVAAQAVGIGHAALEASVSWAGQRKSFGVPIGEHQGIQFMLADMATRLDASRLLTYRAAALRDAGQPFSRESSMAKLYASEAAMFIATKAVQIHGGYGYFKEAVVERCFRDAKITEIYEGTSEVQRMVIARTLFRGNR